MDNSQNLLFTFDVKGMEDIYIDCEDQVSIASSLLKDFFLKEETDKNFLSILCESYSLNYKMKEQIEHWFDHMPITTKDDKQIITVSQSEAMLLEATVFAREQIKMDLRKKYNISNHFN